MSSKEITPAKISPWTEKFSGPLLRMKNSNLQKISATEKGQLILSVYKPGDDRSLVILSMKIGESGILLTHDRPQALKQPNSFVQITRKYLLNRKCISASMTISPICLVLEFSEPSEFSENSPEQNEGPNTLVLHLDAKPPSIILAKKTLGVPERYQKECGLNFSERNFFFESFCEWSEEKTKTKRRACFTFPLVQYCPLVPAVMQSRDDIKQSRDDIKQSRDDIIAQSHLDISQSENDNNKSEIRELLNLPASFSFLPTHIRKSARTKLQFLERRLLRQKADLPTDDDIAQLKKQSHHFKQFLHLWPPNSPTWQVPLNLVEEHELQPVYTLQAKEKPSAILNQFFRKIEILQRRRVELLKRIQESEHSLEIFKNRVIESANQLKFYQNEAPLEQLCQYLGIEFLESDQVKKIKTEKEKRLPYRSFVSSQGHFIRVARSAIDGETMLKLMPSHHTWLHVLTGEGSHVWLEKLKNEKKISPLILREASILAIHYSKQSRAQNAEVQYTTRANIEKKKNLPLGKVLVRRCETISIRYTSDELKKIIGAEL